MNIVNLISTQDPIYIPIGLLQPPIYGTILAQDGSTQDMTGATAVFFMRPLLSRTPVISSAVATPIVPANDEGNNVVYYPQSGDTAIEGEYMGWFGYILPGSTLEETPEFRIFITDQGPGYGSKTGVIVDAVSMFMPITVSALRQHPQFGDRFLQMHADYIKRWIMGTVVSPDQETAYDPVLVEYLSKRTAIRLITPAKDYWARQYRTSTSQGPTEIASYPDMLKNLEDLRCRLEQEAIQDWRQLQFLVPNLPQRQVEPMPISSLGDPQFYPHHRPATPDPDRTRRPDLGGPRWGIFFP